MRIELRNCIGNNKIEYMYTERSGDKGVGVISKSGSKELDLYQDIYSRIP